MKALSLFLLLSLCSGCTSLKRTSLVGGGAGVGAAGGALVAGPAGAIGGAVIGGAAASAMVESDIAEGRTERLEDKLTGVPRVPEPPWYMRIPWWTWLIVLWVYLRRAHLADALTGKEPRMDAILRALGWRTHHTPIPPKKGGRA